MRGILAGALTLVALHTLVAYEDTGDRFKELVGPTGVLVGFVRRFLDPSIPAIADRSGTGKQVIPGTPKPTASSD